MFTEQGALQPSRRQQIMDKIFNLDEAQAQLEKDWREDLATIREACECYAISPVRIGDYQQLYFTRCTAIKTEDRPNWQWKDVRVEAVADVLEAILDDVFGIQGEKAA